MFPIPEPSRITGLILAGGQARRLDGQDKGLIKLGNQTHQISHSSQTPFLLSRRQHVFLPPGVDLIRKSNLHFRQFSP